MSDHNLDCDVNDFNIEGIQKPCNCGAGSSLASARGCPGCRKSEFPVRSCDLLAAVQVLEGMAAEEATKMEQPGIRESTYSVYLGRHANRFALLHCAKMLRDKAANDQAQ